jgi:hypothetical protein
MEVGYHNRRARDRTRPIRHFPDTARDGLTWADVVIVALPRHGAETQQPGRTPRCSRALGQGRHHRQHRARHDHRRGALIAARAQTARIAGAGLDVFERGARLVTGRARDGLDNVVHAPAHGRPRTNETWDDCESTGLGESCVASSPAEKLLSRVPVRYWDFTSHAQR